MHLIILPLIFALISNFDVVFADCSGDKPKNANGRLKSDLLCGYDKTIRPVLNHENATKVRMRMVVKYFQLEEHSGAFVVDNWLTMHWYDQHLKWKPEDYENIKYTHLATDSIWVPDISVYNREAQSGSPAAFDAATCIISFNGLVVCVPPTRQSSLCVPDLTRYPFDTQNCTVRFGSWVHSGEEIDFAPDQPPVGLSDLVPNGKWKLLDANVVRHPGKYKCCPNNTYPSINYSFKIQRLTGHHTATLILPAIALIVITLTSLWLSPLKPERLMLCCVNLICQYLYLENVTWIIPENGEKVPLIVQFARDSLFLCTFTIFFSVLLKNMLERNNKTSPIWISGVVSMATGNRLGQYIFLSDNSLKGIASVRGEEDGANIIDKPESGGKTAEDGLIFAKILDFLCFVSYCIVYFCMFVAFTP